MKSLLITRLRLVSYKFPLVLPTPCVGYQYSVLLSAIWDKSVEVGLLKANQITQASRMSAIRKLFLKVAKRRTCFEVLPFCHK